MDINKAFPSKYLKAADAEDGDLTLTIARVKTETIGQGAKAETKPVVYFSETEKGLCLNKTNANMIVQIAQSGDTDDWTGKKIRLIATEVEFQGSLVMSLRVRSPQKAAKPSKPAQQPVEQVDAPDDDSITF